MDIIASAMLVATFGITLACFILMCFLWVKLNKIAQEHTFLAIRNADLARELAFLRDEVRTSGAIEAVVPPEGARQRNWRTRHLGPQEGGHHGQNPR